MNQQRLNIIPRKISQEEENHRSNLERKLSEIKEAYEELNRLVQLQGGIVGEPDELLLDCELKANRIQTMIRAQKAYIKKIEKEFQQLQAVSNQVAKQSQKQTTIQF